MKKVLLFILSVFVFTQYSFGQNIDKKNNNLLSRKFIITLGEGLTIASTDYPSTKLGSVFKTSLEYIFPSSTDVNFGIKAFGARGIFNGEDRIGVVNEFFTPFFYVGVGPTVTFTFSEKVYTTFSAGISSLWFYPKDIRGVALPNYSANVYDNQTLATNVDLTVRFMTSDKISLNFFGGVFIGAGSNNDYFDDIVSNNNNDFVLSTGVSLSYYFDAGKDSDSDGIGDSEDMCPNTPMGVKVDDFGCPLDADKDGVADYLDKCPDTPSGVKVDNNGCPLDSDGDGVADYLDKCSDTPSGVKVDNNGCPLDSDGDGVADYLDKCSDTPSGVKVDDNGCPLDSDGDGVADYLDKCPDTPKGDKVDKNGCSILEPIIIGTVANFNFDGSDLLKEAYSKLNNVANSMKEQTRYTAIVEGYTDATGPESYNLILSKRRAESVIKYLVNKGVDKTRLNLKAFGEANPVATNNTRKGRAQNRRVVVKLVPIN